MPIVFSLIGLAITIFCLFVLVRAVGMLLRRRACEAIIADITDEERSQSEDKTD